jgi:hypothetical protein
LNSLGRNECDAREPVNRLAQAPFSAIALRLNAIKASVAVKAAKLLPDKTRQSTGLYMVKPPLADSRILPLKKEEAYAHAKSGRNPQRTAGRFSP